MANYYVDFTLGNDENDGLSTGAPWKTIAKINALAPSAGDSVLFEKGETWSGSTTNDMLDIHHSGSEGSPITFSSYGSGLAPIIANSCTTGGYKKPIKVNADWIVVDGLRATGSSIDGRGIDMMIGADYNIVRNCEVDDCCHGIWTDGQHNLITLNYVHDLRFDATAGSGAQGITTTNSDNEISYNDIRRCRDNSVAFGYDGRAIELYGADLDNTYVHHNFATENQGFIEIGGPLATYDTNHAANVLISYNISVSNYNVFFTIHGDPTNNADEAVTLTNCRFYNNTICEPTSDQQYSLAQYSHYNSVNDNQLILRNNIFYVGKFYWIIPAKDTGPTPDNNWAIVHDHNCFYRIYGTATKVGLDDTSTNIPAADIGADPKFVNASGLFNTATDFRLQSDSPCIDAGVDVGLTADYDGHPIN